MPLALEKREGPAHVLVFLGVVVDTGAEAPGGQAAAIHVYGGGVAIPAVVYQEGATFTDRAPSARLPHSKTGPTLPVQDD